METVYFHAAHTSLLVNNPVAVVSAQYRRVVSCSQSVAHCLYGCLLCSIPIMHILKTVCMWIYLPVLWAEDQ